MIIVASGAAVVSFMGYTSYAPTKWALRGFADALRNEMVGLGVSVHLAYPPDTETPGFEHENLSKPPETAAMVPVDVYPADKVARSLLRGAVALPVPSRPIRLILSHPATSFPSRPFPAPPCPSRPISSRITSPLTAPLLNLPKRVFSGAETGLYHLPGPDPLLNLLVSSMAGVSPRAYPCLEILLLPLCALVEALAVVYFDYWGRKYGRRHSAAEAQKDQKKD